jgi:hypothetical protein
VPGLMMMKRESVMMKREILTIMGFFREIDDE